MHTCTAIVQRCAGVDALSFRMPGDADLIVSNVDLRDLETCKGEVLLC